MTFKIGDRVFLYERYTIPEDMIDDKFIMEGRVSSLVPVRGCEICNRHYRVLGKLESSDFGNYHEYQLIPIPEHATDEQVKALRALL